MKYKSKANELNTISWPSKEAKHTKEIATLTAAYHGKERKFTSKARQRYNRKKQRAEQSKPRNNNRQSKY